MTWWHRLFRPSRMEQQLEKELRFHLDQHAADLIAQGQNPGDARRQARLALGGPEQVKEKCRDTRGTRWLEDLIQDFRYALRSLRQKPGFSAVALLTLALGTGATTVMFTVINGVLLKPLAFPEPDRLVTVQEQTDWSTQWGNLWSYTYPNFVDCKRESRSLDLAAWRNSGGTISEPGEAEHVDAREISSGLFSMLGVAPVQGRGFRSEEDRVGAAPVAVISYSLWQSRYAQSPSATGKPLVYDGKTYTVIGVAPAGFQLGGEEADVFTLLGQNTQPFTQNREAHGTHVWARLRPGVSLARAQAELALIGRRLAEQYPKSNKGRSFLAQALRPDAGDVRSTLWLLLGAVSLVLLIACANIASLLLARAISRERELAMRAALGLDAGAWRVNALPRARCWACAEVCLESCSPQSGFVPLCCCGRVVYRAQRKSGSIGTCCCLPWVSLCSAVFFSALRRRCGFRRANWNGRSAPGPAALRETRSGCTAASLYPRSRWPWCCWSLPECLGGLFCVSRPSTRA
jgi:hypothetical protein